MNGNDLEEVKRLFEAALELDPAERSVYLDEHCKGTAALQREVEYLLKHNELAGTFLQEPVVRNEAVPDLLDENLMMGGILDRSGPQIPTAHADELARGLPAVIGPYHLVQLIGSGGMGEVWLSEQKYPVRRRVALKLIKAGMDTREVVMRFESERLALALMDHPAIAKAFDAGSTPQGRPYFVMEYVPGLPITTCCDKYRLSIRERLELMIQVCEGVQHAHQKAIIHRDLKPSNILVREVDGRRMPKLIDFGVAKALGQRLTVETMFAYVGSVIGTPEYMSPEQADSAGTDVDTRTDVYSLGVILYELLVGALPYDFHKLGFDEIRHALREEEKPRPSTRLRKLGDQSRVSAQNRHTDVATLSRELGGDLDAITLKALASDRSRRYQTPLELAADLRRYLQNEPVTARLSSLGYRSWKYVRRHRLGVTVATALVVLLISFALTEAWQLQQINRERDRADRVANFMTSMFKVSNPSEARGNKVTAREILDKGSREITAGFANDPLLQAQMMDVMGTVYFNLGLYSQAEPLLSRAVNIRRHVLGPKHSDTLESFNALGNTLVEEGRYREAERLHREAFDIERRVLGPDHPKTLISMNKLALDLGSLGRYGEANKPLQAAIETQRRVLGQDDRDTLNSMNDLANNFEWEGRHAEAEKLHRETLDRRRLTFGPKDRDTLISMVNLANSLNHEGQYAEAEKLLREARDIEQRILGPDLPEFASITYNLACIAALTGKTAEALSWLRDAVEHGLSPRALVAIPDDPDLQSLHGDARFEAIVVEARQRAVQAKIQ